MLAADLPFGPCPGTGLHGPGCVIPASRLDDLVTGSWMKRKTNKCEKAGVGLKRRYTQVWKCATGIRQKCGFELRTAHYAAFPGRVLVRQPGPQQGHVAACHLRERTRKPVNAEHRWAPNTGLQTQHWLADTILACRHNTGLHRLLSVAVRGKLPKLSCCAVLALRSWPKSTRAWPSTTKCKLGPVSFSPRARYTTYVTRHSEQSGPTGDTVT